MPATHADANRALTSLLAINVLVGVAMGILQMIIPLYAMAINASTVQLGLISGAGGVGRLLIVLPSGLLIDRYGARLLFLAGILISTLSVLTLHWTRTPELLMIVMVLQNTAQSVGFLALQAGFLKRLPFLPAAKAGWQRGATQFGYFLIGPILCGILLQDNRFNLAFNLVGALFASTLCISWYRRRSGAREVMEKPAKHQEGGLFRFGVLLADQTLRQVLLIECIGAAAFTIFRAFISPVAVDLLHLQVGQISLLILCQGVTAMTMLLGGGRLLLRMPLPNIYTVAVLLATAGSLLLATAGGFYGLLAGAIVFGSGTGLMSLTSLTLIGRVNGEKGKIAALFSFSVGIGTTAGPVLAGYVGESLSLQTVFLTMLPFIVVSCMIFLPEKAPT